MYPSAGLDTAHHNVAWELGGDRRFNPAATTVASVLAEVAAFDGDAILSSEDFESVLHRPQALAPLLDPLRRRGREICVVVYLREPVGYRESLYVELIEHGLDVPFAAVRDEIEATGALRWRDWVFHFDAEAVERALRALPDTRVVIRRFEQAAAGSPVCDLLTVMDQPAALLGEAAFARANARVGAEVILGMFCAARLARALTADEQELVDRLGGGARLVDRAMPAGSPPAYQLVRVCSQRTAEEVARIAALPAEARATAAAALTRLWAAPPTPPAPAVASAPPPPPAARRPRIGSVRHLLRRALGR